MGHTLLIGDPGVSWREWLKVHRGGRDLIVLDPADATWATPGRLSRLRGERVVASRFYGSLDPLRAPHVLVAGLVTLLEAGEGDVVVQLFPARSTPLVRQTVLLLAQLLQPTEIFVSESLAIGLDGFPIGPETVELEPAFPAMVQTAQRKAHWLKLLEQCQRHEIDLARVTLEGSRLGSGWLVPPDRVRRSLPGTLRVEAAGGTLMVVAEEDPEENAVSRALDEYGCSRAAIVHPNEYEHLLCAFAKGTGEDFGMGILERIDFGSGVAHVLCTAEPPAPVRVLRLGSLKVSPAGNEEGEIRPWAI